MYCLIPGKKLFVIKDNMIENMQEGSVIYDLAEFREYCIYTSDKIIEKNGIKIMGEHI